jgi:DNA repair protein SbcC/Rad50
VDGLLEAAEQALAAGQVGAARQTLAEARQRLDAIGGEAPRDLARRLNRIGAAIAELRDWQTFVTAPKREALCEALQALVDHPLAPPDQADRLKALRAEWRELGPITRKADAQLADRFNALAEQAFEPCREYFAQQAEIRRANLAERTRICDQLAQYLTETDWQRADMKAAEQILRTAREAWRQYLPVDRGAGRAVEARFESLQDELYGRLKAFWTGNGEAKRAIVEEAEALAIEEGDLDGRINRVKGLQQRWRGIGPTLPRAQDQALWNAFRSACDALFSARDTARTAADSELRQIAGQCAAALDDFENELATLTPESATEAQARGLRERVRELDSLPPPLRQPLAARRSDLLARHQAMLREQGRAARRNRLGELQAQDATFSQAEIAHRDGGPAPEAPARCFDGRLGRHADPVPYDALRRLTLHAEQAAGIAAPAADESLRLEIQVERLRAGLGGSADETPLALAERWCAMGPKDASVDPLRTRFFAALAARQDA